MMESAPGPETFIDGVRYLYFGGTSYLGLAGRQEVIDAGCEALRRYGVHTATSRSRCGTSPPVLEVERRAAEFFGTESAFYFASGYVSNHVLVAALAASADTVVVDASAHYCVHEAARLTGLPVAPFRGRDPADLVRAAGGRGRVLALSDAVVPTTGETAPVADYMEALSEAPQATLMLDDAHGFGVLGACGRGLAEHAGFWPAVNRDSTSGSVRLVIGGTLSKALGGFGGIIPGTRGFVERARLSSHYFDGASAPASAEAGATAKALELVAREPGLRRRLAENSQRLRRGLRALGLPVPDNLTAHFGLVIGDAPNMQRLHVSLKLRGLFVPYFGAYAGIPATGLLRFAVFANHTEGQIDRLVIELGALL